MSAKTYNREAARIVRLAKYDTDASPIVWAIVKKATPYPSFGTFNGSGGAYEIQLIRGLPVTLDPTSDLVTPIRPAEHVVANADGSSPCVGFNMAETNQSDPASHWVEPGTVVMAQYWRRTNETPRRAGYRFFVPRPGPAVILAGTIQPSGLPSGRYVEAAIMTGSIATDLFNTPLPFQPPDPGTAFPNVSAPPLSCWFSNLVEAGSRISGGTAFPSGPQTQVSSDGGYALGMYVGMDKSFTPVYYGILLPSGNAFLVGLSVTGSGTDGDASHTPSYVYNLLTTSGQSGGLGPGGQAPILNRSVADGSFFGSYYPAQMGLAYIQDGQIFLAYAFEQPKGILGDLTWKDGNGTTHVDTYHNGRLVART